MEVCEIAFGDELPECRQSEEVGNKIINSEMTEVEYAHRMPLKCKSQL